MECLQHVNQDLLGMLLESCEPSLCLGVWNRTFRAVVGTFGTTSILVTLFPIMKAFTLFASCRKFHESTHVLGHFICSVFKISKSLVFECFWWSSGLCLTFSLWSCYPFTVALEYIKKYLSTNGCRRVLACCAKARGFCYDTLGKSLKLPCVQKLSHRGGLCIVYTGSILLQRSSLKSLFCFRILHCTDRHTLYVRFGLDFGLFLTNSASWKGWTEIELYYAWRQPWSLLARPAQAVHSRVQKDLGDEPA